MRTSYPVTAFGILTALGRGREEHLAKLTAGRSGLQHTVTNASMTGWLGRCPISLPALEANLAAFDTRLTRIAALLLDDMGEDLERVRRRWGAERVAVLLGSSNAGVERTEEALLVSGEDVRLPKDYDFERQHCFGGFLHTVQELSGFQGPAWVVSTACSSSAKVFGAALRLLDAGLADAVLAGGLDTLCRLTNHGFDSLGLVSAEACRPFGARRDGLNLGEGGAFLLIEREGEAPAALLAVGESSDAHHLNAPSPEGVGAALAMSRALAGAGISAGQIDFVQAHGTGTPLNDAAEALAIRAVFDEPPPVLSTKAYTGHLLGACGAVEAVFTLLALEEGWLPPSLGADPQDPEIELRIPQRRTACPSGFGISNSFGFGGSNASVVFQRRDACA